MRRNDITLNEATAINAIGDLLQQHRDGRGIVTFKVTVEGEEGYDIDIELKDKYKISPDIRPHLVALEGVTDVREI